jgi:mono/diheme cytochrome c family protein
MPGGGAMMLHQRARSVVSFTQAYYNGVHAAISVFHSPGSGLESATEVQAADAFSAIALAVDIAVAPDGEQIAMVAAGSDLLIRTWTSSIQRNAGSGSDAPEMSAAQIAGEPVAVAFDQKGRVVVQTRSPSLVVLEGQDIVDVIDLPGESRADSAHDLFHRPSNAFSGIACASCHPEGHEDGRTWTFEQADGSLMKRRTPNIGIGGGLLKTAPFHWRGDLADLSALVNDVFVTRMGGEDPGPRRIELLSRWLDQLPALPPSTSADNAAIERGEALFASQAVGCASCHTGPSFTNNTTVDVGTGTELQVPSLISIASRAPFMHDGCVTTLHERFTNPCAGGDKHGHVSELSADEIDDLVAYLESL